MQDRIKNNIITCGFVIFLIGMFFMNIFTEDKQISIAERRKLAQFPEITLDKLLSGSVSENLEKYTTDQIVFRDNFRSIKTFWSINVFNQKDNNGLFVKENSIYKMEYPLNINNVIKSFDKINRVYEKYLQNMNVHYAIIPDKNYYLENDDHLKIEYDKLKEIAKNTLLNMKYIDIWGYLELNDYYRTDLHWKQENIIDVVNTIQKHMNLEETSTSNYIVADRGEFYGTYYSQLGIEMLPDKMYTLTNNIIEECITYNFENNKIGKVYDDFASMDRYDIYLSGATPLISIDNPNTTTEKELLLFRDSFGSSIAPLLIQNYRKITLIDLRYISSDLLDEYINFNNQDVIFLYSSLILNQNVLK